jgi:hypothetical protein
LRSETGRQRDRPAAADAICAQAHNVDLSNQLVGDAERPVVIRQLNPRPEACGPARADDVDFADAIKERGERLGVGDVDPLACVA